MEYSYSIINIQCNLYYSRYGDDQMQKPNVLFLFSDQHNAKCTSYAEHPHVKTPHLDRLVKEGTLFTNAYCNNPICTPSRMSFLSSLYPSTHGYYGLYGHEPNEPITNMFSYLKEYGYRTGALGKLHTPRYWIEKDCQFIYDEFIEYPKYLEAIGLYDQNDNRAFTGNKDSETSLIPYDHSCESVLAKQALRFIDNLGEPKDRGMDEQPWFAWVSFSRPHQPYTPSEPFASMYPADSLQLPPAPTVPKNACIIKDDKELRDYMSAYFALISQVDYSIGAILTALEERGQLDHTIIIYSADHGDYAGEHHLMEKRGGISSRAITNIPFIIRLPKGMASPMKSDALIESVDLFPTLCEILDMPVPNTCQGTSFYDLIRGNKDDIKEYALTENPYRKAIATKEWRFIANLPDEEDELYNIHSDPWELDNLIQNPAYKEIVSQLQRALLYELTKARKPINTINGGWHNHCYDRDGRIDLNTCGPLNAYW